MVTKSEAQALALAWIRDQWSPQWDPAVVHVEDAGTAWRVFYNNRAYLESKSVLHALSGNHPLLVSKVSGAVTVDAAHPRI